MIARLYLALVVGLAILASAMQPTAARAAGALGERVAVAAQLSAQDQILNPGRVLKQRVAQIPGIMQPLLVAQALPVVTTYVTSNGAGSGSTITYTAIGIGTDVPGRTTLATFGYKDSANPTTDLTSATICGVTSSKITNPFNDGASTWITGAIAALTAGAGTTCNIVLTFNNSITRGVLWTYQIVNMQNVTKTSSGGGSAVSPCVTGAVNVPAGGVLMGVAYGNSSVTTTFTDSGTLTMTKDNDQNVGANSQATSHSDAATGQSGITLTATGSSSYGGGASCLAAVFR